MALPAEAVLTACVSDVWQSNTDRLIVECETHGPVAGWDIAHETVSAEMIWTAWSEHLAGRQQSAPQSERR